jgi:hypothetical protein
VNSLVIHHSTNGNVITWTYTADCAGQLCKLSYDDGQGHSNTIQADAGSDQPLGSWDYGYSAHVTMSATVRGDRDDSTAGARDGPVATPPKPNPVITINPTGRHAGCNYWRGGACPYVELNVSGIPAGNYSIDCWAAKSQNNPGPGEGSFGMFRTAPWSIYYDGTGTLTDNTNGSPDGHCWFGYRDRVYVRLSGPGGTFDSSAIDPW